LAFSLHLRLGRILVGINFVCLFVCCRLTLGCADCWFYPAISTLLSCNQRLSNATFIQR